LAIYWLKKCFILKSDTAIMGALGFCGCLVGALGWASCDLGSCHLTNTGLYNAHIVVHLQGHGWMIK
jgi:hypothetical protein